MRSEHRAPRPEPGAYTAHVDTFARDNLPPRNMWPQMDYSVLPELAYPARVNCARELLDRAAEEGERRTAIHFPGGAWSYGRLLETANRIAHVLVEEFGLAPGNRVLLRGPNNPMMAASWFAILKAGGICVCTMPLLRPRELSYIIEKARVTLALTDARIAGDLEQAQRLAPALERMVRFGGGVGSLESVMARKPPHFDAVDTAADDVAIIAFTSGTTGQAKGTMHFHRDILAVADLFPRSCLRASRDDMFCGSPPLAFTYGLGGLLLFPMRIGASTLLLEQATPPHLVKAIAEFRASVCFTAPTAYRAMAPLARDHDLSSLRKCVSAGETLPAATFEGWQAATGIKIIDGIGSTELLHIFISAPEEEIRPGATGRVVPGYQAKLVNEDGNDVPVGSLGRLAVRGPTGCRYLDNIERQQAYVQNGWNITGDTYRMDEDGYFWYQARSDDMIISSGYNLSGPEVENVLLEHPNVLECGVVGVPDPERGQIVKAYVVLRPGVEKGADTAKELQDFVKAELAPYKYPRSVEFVDSLPRTETGKLQRFRLREHKA
jgi:2-aminobenzoate-CoA ligase